jgi:hypothetical protein
LGSRNCIHKVNVSFFKEAPEKVCSKLDFSFILYQLMWVAEVVSQQVLNGFLRIQLSCNIFVERVTFEQDYLVYRRHRNHASVTNNPPDINNALHAGQTRHQQAFVLFQILRCPLDVSVLSEPNAKGSRPRTSTVVATWRVDYAKDPKNELFASA